MNGYIIIMGGSTGAGKTTHGQKLALSNNWLYISSGDIARSLMDAKTDALFKEGQLSPHETLIREQIKRGLTLGYVSVLDGFPRVKEQYGVLFDWAQELNKKIILVWIMPSRTVLEHRWNTRSRDAYDTGHAALKRDELYQTETAPLLEDLTHKTDYVKVEVHEIDEPIEYVNRVISENLGHIFDKEVHNAGKGR